MANSSEPARTDTRSADTIKGTQDTAPIRMGLIELRLTSLEPLSTAPASPERQLIQLKPGKSVELDCGRIGGASLDGAKIKVELLRTECSFSYRAEVSLPDEELEERALHQIAIERIDPDGEELATSIAHTPAEARPGERLRIGRRTVVLPFPELSLAYEGCAFGHGAGVLSSADGAQSGSTLFGEFAASTRRRVTLLPEDAEAEEAFRSRKFDRNNQDGYLKLDGFVDVDSPELRTVFIAGDGLGAHGGGSVACRAFFRGAQRALEQGAGLEEARIAGALSMEAEYRAYREQEILDRDSVLGNEPDLDPNNTGEVPSPEMGLCYLGIDCRSHWYRVQRHGDCKAAHFRFDRRAKKMNIVLDVLADSAAQEAISEGSLRPEDLHRFKRRNVTYGALALSDGRLNRVTEPGESLRSAILPPAAISDWISIEPGDWIVAGSDGFWTRFGLCPELVGEQLAQCHDPVSAWHRFEKILKRMTLENPRFDDDTTMIFYRHRSTEAAATAKSWGWGVGLEKLRSRFLNW